MRSQALRMVRDFFYDRGVIEADVPALSPYGSIDPYIDLIETKDGGHLHSSPEYALKRLICEDSGDIYYLGHTFRKEEKSPLHNSEFTMIEWYRLNTDEKTFLQEVVDLISLFLGDLPVEMVDYEEAYRRYARPIGLEVDTSRWTKDDCFFYQWAKFVEPNLGKGHLTILTNFPKEHAVLARTRLVNGEEKAGRYEIYYEGIELGNGFDELSDPDEHLRRFIESNELRKAQGKTIYPIDELFLAALKNGGIPSRTFGIAVGFDRLLMLGNKKEHIYDVLSIV